MTKREIEKLRRYRCAVITLAHQSAKRAIKRQFQAQGVRLGDLTAKQIAIWAHAWFESHSVELIAEAEHVIATSPYFERWRIPVFEKIEVIEHSPNADSANAGVIAND